jgi:hypothetical protein
VTLPRIARVCLIAALVPAAGCAVHPMTGPTAPRAIRLSKPLQVEVAAAYDIHVGGTMDSYNTHTYEGIYRPGFQANLELIITNNGDRPIRDPRISINGTGDWFDMDALVRASIGPARGGTQEEKAYALWDFCRRSIDAGPSYNGQTLWGPARSVVRFMNCFGSGACGTFHRVMPLIGQAGGLNTEEGCLANCSHAVQREVYQGRDHYFDALMPHGGGLPSLPQPRGYVPLELDYRTVASVASLMADHYLVERCGTTGDFYMNVAYFGPGSSFNRTNKEGWKDPWTMGLTLRPGESIRRTWTPVTSGWLTEVPSPASSAEGTVVFEPHLTAEAVRRDAVSSSNLVFKDQSATAGGAGPGEIVYELHSPYVLIATKGEARFDLPPEARERARVEMPIEGGEPVRLWQAIAGGSVQAEWQERRHPIFHKPRLTHCLRFRVTIPPGGSLKSLRMEAIFQAYVLSLPTLRCGANRVEYCDSTPVSHAVLVEHRWRESSQFKPPSAPMLVAPADTGQAGYAPRFEWKAPPGKIEAYEVFVSPRDDLAWPVLAPFHSVIPGNEVRFTSRVVDALNDGQRYWWHVRARGQGGVWSPWSPTWSFVARGPHPPANVTIKREADREMLAWGAPQGGAPIDYYEVYGSADCDVSPRREPDVGQAAGRTIDLPATLIETTRHTSFEVTARPEAFYRVVAVDAAGSRSAPSPIVAAARPAWLPLEPSALVRGQAWSFTPSVRRGTGRWVLSLRQGMIREKADAVQFRLMEGPSWLAIDPEKGTLTGTAPVSLSGTIRVVLEAAVPQVGSAQRVLVLKVAPP